MPHGVGPVGGSSIPSRYFIVQHGVGARGRESRSEAAPPAEELPPRHVGRSEQPASLEEPRSQEQGVIRNLAAGHYHATAAVRLAINFHDELVLQRSEAVVDAAKSYIADATVALDGFAAAADLNETQAGALDEARTAFLAALALPAEGSGSAEALAAQARAALDDFVVQLQVLSDAGEDAVAVDTTQLVNELTAALEAAFGGDAGSPALEFLQPDGNGVAFAKFVEIYEELQTISEQQAAAPGPESEPPPALDALA